MDKNEELEILEQRVKAKSNERCDICHKKNAEIYVLDTEQEIEEDNLILLCGGCARKYIGNPDLIKQIKEMRDTWHSQVQRVKEKNKDIGILDEFRDNEEEERHNAALYHVVYENEGFKEAANDIFDILKMSKDKSSGFNRFLYLDIDGHIDEHGNFDEEMRVLQEEFILKNLLPYFTEVSMPLLSIRNKEPQREDIPDKLTLISKEEEMREYLTSEMTKGGYIIEKLEKPYYHKEKQMIYKTF